MNVANARPRSYWMLVRCNWFGCSRHGRSSLGGSLEDRSTEISGLVPIHCEAFGLLAKTCAPPLFHMDMKMVLVSFIGIGPKYRAEGFARLIVDKLQKIPV